MSKKMIIALIVLVLIIIIGIGIHYVFRRSYFSQKTGYIIYAVKNGTNVKVIREDINNKAQSLILQYEEPIGTNNLGSAWERLSPSVDLSADLNLLVYIDKNGVKIFDLYGKKTKTIIEKIGEGNVEIAEYPFWRTDLKPIGYIGIDAIYNLVCPKFSFDNKYILITGIPYQGIQGFLINLGEGSFRSFNDSISSEWSPSDYRLISMVEDGLVLHENFNKPAAIIFKGNHFLPKWDPKGDKIALISEQNNYKGKKMLLTIDLINQRIGTIEADRNVVDEIFSNDGGSLFYLVENGKYELLKYDTKTFQKTRLLSLSKDWFYKMCSESKGYLTLFACKSKEGRIYVINLKTGEYVYQSGKLSNFTKILKSAIN